VEKLRLANGQAHWSDAFALAYQRFPHTFVFGLLTAMLAVQLIGLGILALQNKQYFDELFDLGSYTIRKGLRQSKR